MTVDMRPEAVEARLLATSERSPLGFTPLPRVDMSPEAVEARLVEWAEMTLVCLELAKSHVTTPS